MDLKVSKSRISLVGKTLSALDRFVLDFIGVLDRFSEYVVVSGYVCILFGRPRGTEDVDVILPQMNKQQFLSFYAALIDQGYYFLNLEDELGLFEMLDEQLGIRAARMGEMIPNVELKFAKDDFDRYSLENRVEVCLDTKQCVFVAPLELQIPYKLWLGSDKDIEDAVYLWDVLQAHLDQGLVRRFMKECGVSGDQYGISV